VRNLVSSIPENRLQEAAEVAADAITAAADAAAAKSRPARRAAARARVAAQWDETPEDAAGSPEALFRVLYWQAERQLAEYELGHKPVTQARVDELYKNWKMRQKILDITRVSRASYATPHLKVMEECAVHKAKIFYTSAIREYERRGEPAPESERRKRPVKSGKRKSAKRRAAAANFAALFK
jgi:hypothetical protein